MEIAVDKKIKELASNTSFPVYITGGYIRNQLAGLGQTDIDLCGPVVATALGLPKRYIIKTVNFRLGTAIIRHGKDEYEYTPFRTENYLEGGTHTPSLVEFTSDIKKDVMRRDFACNSLYYDIKNNKLIDLVGGVNDCINKIVRAVEPEKTFSSDGLRLMRLVRIAAETGFKIDAKTAATAQTFSNLLADISPERKRDELLKILYADTKYGVNNAHYRALKLMHKIGLTKYILQPLALCEGVEQNPKHHKYDVLEHTFQAVKLASHPSIRLAALMHDLGKPYCLAKFGNMHGHERSSEIICRYVLGEKGLRFPNSLIDETARLCRHHMFDMNGNTSKAKLKMFIVENQDIIDKLVLLNQADYLACGINFEKRPSRLLEARDELIAQNAPMSIGELDINGDELMALGLVGAQIGHILSDMLAKCVLEPRLNNKAWLTAHAKRYLEKQK